ncbi:hypothetical protein Tco_0398912, partial [Tanacetum coccineum]
LVVDEVEQSLLVMLNNHYWLTLNTQSTCSRSEGDQREIGGGDRWQIGGGDRWEIGGRW